MTDLFTESKVEVLTEEIDYYNELVGEGKKFKDNTGLARGKWESDNHIRTLEDELANLKMELKSKMAMEDFLTQMKSSQQQPSASAPQVTEPEDKQTPDLEAVLESLLTRKEAQRLQESNLQRVSRVMEENFQDRANLVINQKAKELGMKVTELQSLATSSPNAFLSLVGAQEGRSNPSAAMPRPGFTPSGQQDYQPVRDNRFYEKMLREDPKRYHSGEITLQMMADAEKLGLERFYAK